MKIHRLPTDLDDADLQEREDLILNHEPDNYNDRYECNESEVEFLRQLGVIN